jgi:hypothetical protein
MHPSLGRLGGAPRRLTGENMHQCISCAFSPPAWKPANMRPRQCPRHGPYLPAGWPHCPAGPHCPAAFPGRLEGVKKGQVPRTGRRP